MGTGEPKANGHSRDQTLLVRLRAPHLSDGSAIWDLVRVSESPAGGGEPVFPVLAKHFADTSLVAEADGRVVGFAGGYRSPTHRPSLFLWQIDVHPTLQGQGLGTALLHSLVQCPGCAGIEYVEAIVHSSNHACRRLFERFARDLDAACEVAADYGPDIWSSMSRERRDRFRIGPICIDDAVSLDTSHETL